MKQLLILFTFAFLATGANAQVLRSMTPRYNNPSVKGNIVYVANNIITSSGVITTEAPPGGTAVNNGNTGANIDIEGPFDATIIPYGDTWRYLVTPVQAPAGWQNLGFNDAAWPQAPAELGYGDGDEATVIGFGGVPANKYITTYFRRTVNIANPSAYGSFQFDVERDDGYVLYVNGVEISRNNMPGGAVVWGTLATAAIEDGVITVNVPNTAFAIGANDIAVEVHQAAANSSDLSFNLRLQGLVNATLIPFGSSWKYLDNNTRPANWETVAYNDAAWVAGNGYLGYGDPHIITTVGFGADPNNKYITTYFRHAINITNPALYTQYIAKLRRDDGAVVYVNGIEVGRSNMPAGAVAHGTLAAGNVGGAAETADNLIYINPSSFVVGNNVIAVEVHQELANSTDLTFDLSLEATNDTLFNSSSANLALPTCSQVLFAGLYWGATQGTDGTNTTWISNETAVKLKLPGASTFTSLTSTQTDYHNDVLVPGLPHTGYRCFVDITSLVNSTSPNGTYTIANVCSPAGIVNTAGGWTIVIAYSDPATTVKNLTVFDGSVIMNGGDPALHIPITGFLTPPSGPVSCELGAVVFDGDRVSTDEFSFKQDSNPLIGVYTSLTPNATANLNDMWNSTITHNGVVVTTRNPAHNNTLGYDADILTVPNALNAVLGNSQSSASIRFSSPSENYMLQVATTAISQYTPTFAVSKTATDLDGGGLDPGDSIRYQVNYRNGGNDASTATTITDRIPTGTSYAPNSLFISGVAKTDAIGDDEAEYDFTNNRVVFRLGAGANGSSGGEIDPGISGNVTFKVYTPSSCAVFLCNSTISNRARMSYGGKLSLLSLEDSSGVDIAGCIAPDPVNNIMTGSCAPLADTVLTNICPSTTVLLPRSIYAGYEFHSGIPFTPANRYNPATPITFTRIIYAYYDGPGSCDDTIRINVFITSCPDIDDDNDGIPDYVEIDDPLALANWSNAAYPGYTDNNSDGFNDNFDPSADSDNDGNPNFYDSNFPGWLDSNGDGVNDRMDKDLDGIPNHLDLDSDNDGIPDTVESFGVDANGDGLIDNYSDSDNDGLSQNVDNPGGVLGSGLGLDALDTDGDGIGNYLDLDSDNDGIPDITEAFGTDAANSARVSVFADTDGDGYADALDADVGNDLVAENSGSSILRTSADGNGDGRTDSWPFKNMDSDSKPSPYDLDSDGDGVSDVKEAQFTDANWDGRVDGAINANGRNTALAALGSLTIPNSESVGRADPYDIDADEDGIPDNVEGLTTLGYLLPAAADTDGDGIDNSYDNFNGFGGDGIHPVDTDGDTAPDYLDNDTDGDGLIDRIEGNDFNLNGQQDDNVALTGTDTDGDGLDDRFDANNSSVEATSARMGNGGTITGDPTPGSNTPVQHTVSPHGCATERDWRCVPYVLSCEFITFKALLQNQKVKLDWTALCRQEVDYFVIERSTDRTTFSDVLHTPGKPTLNEVEVYNGIDNISGITAELIFYRLRSVMKSGRIIRSNIIAVKRSNNGGTEIKILPNPVTDRLQLLISTVQNGTADIHIMDATGRVVSQYKENLQKGNNTITYTQVANLPDGMYFIKLQMGQTIVTQKFNKLK